MFSLKLNPKELKTDSGTGKILFTHNNISKLDEFPEGPLIEIIHGEIYLAPSPTPIHQEISANLEFRIRKLLMESPKEEQLGKLFDAPIDVVLSDINTVIPDLVFIKKDNLHIVKEKAIEGIPDLVVEVLSTNRKYDLKNKKGLYENFGITEYWIIDPENKTISIYKYNEEKSQYLDSEEFKGEQIVKSHILDGLEMKANEIFPE